MKVIKYSMVDMFALNGIVDGYKSEMNNSSIDLTRLCTALIGELCYEKRLNELLWVIGYCGNQEDVTNTGMVVHSDLDHRKYSGSAGRKEEVRYG